MRTSVFRGAVEADESSRRRTWKIFEEKRAAWAGLREHFGQAVVGEEGSPGFPGKRHRSEGGCGRFSVVARGAVQQRSGKA